MGRFGIGNWSLKALSLILAVVLWIYVSNELNPTKEQEFKAVPIESRGTGPNLAVTLPPGGVNVRLQASQNVMAGLSQKNIEVFVDLSQSKPGKTMVPVQVRVPAGIKVTDLRPAEIHVMVEPIAEKQVPVKVHYSNMTEKGYRVVAVKSKPDEVILRGPKSIIDKVDFASIDVNVKGRNKSFNETVPVRVSDNKGAFLEETAVKRTPSAVEILVSIGLDNLSKTVQVVPRLTGKPTEGYIVTLVEVEPVELVINGPTDLINGISQITTQPVDITGAQADVSVDVQPELPQGVTANRPSIKVLVKIGQG
ncbi:MAG: hypothetical protein CVV03_03020 [Firmicutes bacterium HGW-Firmicutes-8]|nr:MAG: hypothetical protein CVV03_03020 [Firmicutes bacterium HGW-Firmicutes-8]